MSQPPPYTRQYDFSDYQASYPDVPLPGDQLDIELNTVKTNLDGLNNNIALLQKDDGSLRNAIVGVDNIDTSLIALIGADGYALRGTWAASTAYNVSDLVEAPDGATYICTIAHTSSGSFAADYSANKWFLFANPVGATGDVLYEAFNGNSIQTVFTLSQPLVDERQIFLYVNGAFVDYDAFSVSGANITITSPPPTGVRNVLAVGVSLGATISANSAATSAAASEVSHQGAVTAQIAAESALAQTLSAYDNFDDRYLGPKAADPTLDNDGNALIAGALYFNTVSGGMKVYTGAIWSAAYVDGTGVLLKASNLSDLTSAPTALTNLGGTTVGKAVFTAANAAAARTAIGTVIGTDVQAYSANTVLTSNANTYTAGQKQTFSPNTTTAGINLGSFAGDPSVTVNGDTWYNSSAGKFRCKENGVVKDVGNVGDVTLAGTQSFTGAKTFSNTAQFDGNVGFSQQVTMTNTLTLNGSAGVLTFGGANSYEAFTDTSNLGNVYRRYTTLATTNATPTLDGGVLGAFTGGNSGIYVRAFVTAHRTSGSGTAGDTAGYTIEGVYKREAGTVTLVGSLSQVVRGESVAGYDATLVISGGVIQLQVTGVASTNISWNVLFTFGQVN